MTILLLATSSPFATDLTLGTYTAADVSVSSDGRQVLVDGHVLVGRGDGVTLSAVTYYLRLGDGHRLGDMDIVSSDSIPLGRSLPDGSLDEVATADSIPYHDLVRSSSQVEQLGRQPVMLSERTVGDERWAVLTLFPVTIGADNQLYLHRSIVANLPDEAVHSTPLLDEHQFAAMTRGARSRQASSSSSNYLIITNAELESAMLTLADYRRALGYRAEVRLIDEIVAAYPGRDDAERLRNHLRDYWHNGGDYVVLAGDETVLPVRYAYHYTTSTLPDLYELQLCDLYFAEVEADWDPDNDNVFGERHISLGSVSPQLRVGRLPFNRAEEAEAYIRKLISYESNPGDGSFDYLDRAFFYSSDQMRDLGVDGQHGAIASDYPATMSIDTTSGVESATGNDPLPGNPSAVASLDSLATGYGIVNVLAHGRSDAFGVTTSGYNEWPKSYFITEEFGAPHGDCNALPADNRVSFYYSLACDNAGFDQDQPPLSRMQPNLAQTLLALDSAGAVGFVGYSRWGWVGSSYLLQKAFFEELFNDPSAPAVDAMHRSKERYYYYRDLAYGQNFLGDPALRIWSTAPQDLELVLSIATDTVFVIARSSGAPVSGCRVRLSNHAGIIVEGLTDASGRLPVITPLDADQEYVATGQKDGYTNGYARVRTTFSTDVHNTDGELPEAFALSQNYPNPFNPTTTIEFTLPRRVDLTLSVYNLLGRQVRVLLDGSFPAGSHRAEWDATDYSGSQVASGLYFYRLESSKFIDTRKMLLIR